MARNKEGEDGSFQLWQHISVTHKAVGCWVNENAIQSPKNTVYFLKRGESVKKLGETVSVEICVTRNLGPLPLKQDLGKWNVWNLKPDKIKSEIRCTFLLVMIINYGSCSSKDVLDFPTPEIFQQRLDMLVIISCSARGYGQCYAENQIRNS